ncbi:PA14 domain-containing protein [Flavilitoribacter nigricans]|nr:PA14 domain-containing protein [Flavilitoribacter nigricans]
MRHSNYPNGLTFTLLNILFLVMAFTVPTFGQGSCASCLQVSNSGKTIQVNYSPQTTDYCFLQGYRSYKVYVYIDGALVGEKGNNRYDDWRGITYAFAKGMGNFETGKNHTIQVDTYSVDCDGNRSNSLYRRTTKTFYLPLQQNFSNGFTVTSAELKANGCRSETFLYEGLPSAGQVKTDIINNTGSYFIHKKDIGKKINMKVSIPWSAFISKVTYEVGGYEKQDIFKTHDLSFYAGSPGIKDGNVSFPLYPWQLYLNKDNNYCQLATVKFYRSGNHQYPYRTLIIPLLVTGQQTDIVGETTGPILPQAILHNPPGDNSFTYLERGVSLCKEVNMSYAETSGVNASLGLEVGASAEFIVEVESSVKATVSASQSTNNAKSISTEICYETSARYENYHSDDGLDGDLIIGAATTYDYGPAISLVYQNCRPAVTRKSIAMVPKTIKHFTYTQKRIKESEIPKLEQILANTPANTKDYQLIQGQINDWKKIIADNESQFSKAPYESNNAVTIEGAKNATQSETQVSRTGTYATASTIFFDASLLVEAGISAAGSSVEASIGVNFSTEVSNGSAQTNGNSVLIGYSLADSTPGDLFNIRTRRDTRSGSHYFELQNGTQTSCPYEGGLRRDKLNLTIGEEQQPSAVFTGIPVGDGSADKATIALNVCNYSESNEVRTYRLRALVTQDAIVSYSGKAIVDEGVPVRDIEPGTCKQVEITVDQHTPGQLAYEGIRLQLTDNCSTVAGEEDISSEVVFSVSFQEAASNTVDLYLNFQVDMRNQEVSPEGVFVAGDWQDEAGFGGDWIPGVAPLTDEDGDGIYQGRFLLSQVSTPTLFRYKFINGSTWETVPTDCGLEEFGFTNRSYAIPELTVNDLEGRPGIVCFNECGPCTISCPDEATDLENGLLATYYQDKEMTVEAFRRVDPAVNFDWAYGAPEACMPEDNFAVVWEGYVEAPITENFTFYTTTDDGVRLWIDGQLIIDRWIDQAPTEYTGSVDLQAGHRVPIRMEYYENAGTAVAQLSWSSASQPKTIIPTEQLFTQPSVATFMAVTPEDQTVGADAGELVFSVTGNMNWEVVVPEAEWATYALERTLTEGALTLFYTANETEAERSLTITFTGADGTVVTRTVTQSGSPAVNTALGCQDLEALTPGNLSEQSDRWSKWSEEGADAQIVEENGNQAVHLQYREDFGELQQDMLLLLGDLNTGTYQLQWDMKVAEGKTAYFNTQKFQDEPGAAFGFQIFFEQGTARVETGGASGEFSYPVGEWFNISFTFDFEQDKVILYLNGSGIYQWQISNTVQAAGGVNQLGALDFYAIADADFFLDNICLEEIRALSLGRSGFPTLPTPNPAAKVKPTVAIGQVHLGQNYPNPARNQTAIPLNIPMTIQRVHLEISDLNGRSMGRTVIAERGEFVHEMTLDLNAGIYFYTLYANGKPVSTKRMVVVR